MSGLHGKRQCPGKIQKMVFRKTREMGYPDTEGSIAWWRRGSAPSVTVSGSVSVICTAQSPAQSRQAVRRNRNLGSALGTGAGRGFVGPSQLVLTRVSGSGLTAWEMRSTYIFYLPKSQQLFSSLT